MDTLDLDGIACPKLGFGTWQLKGGDCVESLTRAVGLGYRHIDTAALYDNEVEVGQVIAASGVPREDFFVTTKVWVDQFTREKIPAAVQASLERLKLDHVDLVLLHWPVFEESPLEAQIRALAGVQERGLARLIGVSNYTVRQLERACAVASISTNQVELHPHLDQRILRAAAQKLGVILTAYCPLAHGKIVSDPVLGEIGAAHGKSGAQVALRWLMQLPGVMAVPKARSERNQIANLGIFDFVLSDAEMARVETLHRPDGRVCDPGLAPEWD